jgi:hypothetical protein
MPEGDLCLVDEETLGSRWFEARRRADDAVDVGDGAAAPADHVVVVVVD